MEEYSKYIKKYLDKQNVEDKTNYNEIIGVIKEIEKIQNEQEYSMIDELKEEVNSFYNKLKLIYSNIDPRRKEIKEEKVVPNVSKSQKKDSQIPPKLEENDGIGISYWAEEQIPISFGKFLEEQDSKFKRSIVKLLPKNILGGKRLSAGDKMREFTKFFFFSGDINRRKEENSIISSAGDKIENLEENVEMCGISVPIELVKIILSYTQKDFNLLTSIGLLGYNWFVLVLLSWDVIYVTSKNVFEISLLVLKYSKIKVFITEFLDNKKMEYLLNKLSSNSNLKELNLGKLEYEANDFVKLLKLFKKNKLDSLNGLALPYNYERDIAESDDIFKLFSRYNGVYYLKPYEKFKNVVIKNLKELHKAVPTDLYFFDIYKLKKLNIIFSDHFPYNFIADKKIRVSFQFDKEKKTVKFYVNIQKNEYLIFETFSKILNYYLSSKTILFHHAQFIKLYIVSFCGYKKKGKYFKRVNKEIKSWKKSISKSFKLIDNWKDSREKKYEHLHYIFRK